MNIQKQGLVVMFLHIVQHHSAALATEHLAASCIMRFPFFKCKDRLPLHTAQPLVLAFRETKLLLSSFHTLPITVPVSVATCKVAVLNVGSMAAAL